MSAPCPVFGFLIRVRPNSTMSSAAARLSIAEAIDGSGLELRPLTDSPPAFAITREGSQATETDRQFVIQQLERRVLLADIQVSEVVDLASND